MAAWRIDEECQTKKLRPREGPRVRHFERYLYSNAPAAPPGVEVVVVGRAFEEGRLIIIGQNVGCGFRKYTSGRPRTSPAPGFPGLCDPESRLVASECAPMPSRAARRLIPGFVGEAERSPVDAKHEGPW